MRSKEEGAMTGHSQNVADNLANADILAVVPHQLQGAGWRQGDIEHPAATDVRLAAGVGAAHHIGADETEDSTSTRSSQRGRRPAQSIESIPSRRGRPISTVRATNLRLSAICPLPPWHAALHNGALHNTHRTKDRKPATSPMAPAGASKVRRVANGGMWWLSMIGFTRGGGCGEP
jgi:hypothetical protein